MTEDIKLSDLNKMLDVYESGLKEREKYNQYSETIQGKLETVKDIRHRILVLSRGGFKIIKT
jgi:hypothetical protein